MHLPPHASLRAGDDADILYCPPTPPQSPPLRTLEKSLGRLFAPSIVSNFSHMEALAGCHLHQLISIHLSNGSRLFLKVGPSPSAALLRHEHYHLRSEAVAYSALAKSNLPVPTLLKYEKNSVHLGAPFMLTSRLDGVKYSDLLPHLMPSEKASIERQLRSHSSVISRYSSSRFGHLGMVAMKSGGYKTWREAFVSMIDSIIMDAEDMIVNLAYFQIRSALSRWESCLDDVTEARLVVLGLESPENVLINRKTNEVSGLLDFGQAIWGDPGMMFANDKTDIKSLL